MTRIYSTLSLRWRLQARTNIILHNRMLQKSHSIPVVLLEALKFASEKHARQRRKDSKDTPYINHPIEVAELLVRVGQVSDVNVLVAAILHDTVEDTDTKPDEIEALFGKTALSLVMECTDDKTLPRHERKRLQVENAAHKSPQAKLIKLADKISNVKDMGESPPADWSLERRREYLDWTEEVVHGLRGENPALDRLYDLVLDHARARLQTDQQVTV